MKSFKTSVNGLLDNEKASSGILTAVLIITVLVFNIAVFAIASIFGLSFTVNQREELTLSGNTDQLFEAAIRDNKKVTIYFCYPTADELEVHGTGAYVHKTALDFKERYGSFINIEYLNLMTRKNSRGEDVSGKIKTWQVNSRDPETVNILDKASVVFECGDSYKVVTDVYTSAGFADFYTLDASGQATSYNGEAYMAAMINWVTVKEHPVAYFTVGHSEQFDRAFANILVSAGYYLDTVDLKEEEVPGDADLLIISNPLSDFERASEDSRVRTELSRLETYMTHVDSARNLYVALDPYVGSLPTLEGFLAAYGIKFSESESGKNPVRNIIKDSTNAITVDGFTLVADFADNDIANSVAGSVKDHSDGSVIVRQVAALELSKNAVPLLVTTPSAVLEAQGERVDSSGSYPVAACVKEAVGGKNVASICVMSGVYASVSDALVTDKYSNTDFYYSLFDNFYGQKGMPYGSNVLRWEVTTLENLTMGRAKLYTAIIMAIPATIAIVGIVIVYKRKYR